MEHKENSDQVLNRYFAKAGEEQPVVTIDEVKELITSTPMSATDYQVAEQVLSKFKYWLGGGLIITAGVVSFWMSGSSDNQQSEEIQPEPKTEVIQNEEQPSAAVVDENNITPAAKETAPVIEKENTGEAKTESAEPSKRKTYYYPGVAQVSFESDGKAVTMAIDNDVRSLQIDGVTIDKSEYGSYSEIVERGKAMKFESDRQSQGEVENSEQENNRNVTTVLVNQLKDDDLIDAAGHFEFRLTAFKLYVNNKEQTEEMFQRYKVLYETTSGNKLNSKSNIRIKH